jgi:ubiquinone/menaquinone biosynthesis C-methylase UbiE
MNPWVRSVEAAIRHLILRSYDYGYTTFAWSYDLATWCASGGLWYRWIVAAVGYIDQGPVLDLGCGRGRLLAHLRALGHPALGLDRSPQMARATQRRLRRSGRVAPPVVQGTGHALPFSTGSLGTVITTFPTSYVYEAGTQQEIARVLRPGGRWLWVEAPFPCRPTMRMLLVTLMSALARVERARVISPQRSPLDAVWAALGLSPHRHAWEPRLAAPTAFHVTVEQVAVGPTYVHVAILEPAA